MKRIIQLIYSIILILIGNKLFAQDTLLPIISHKQLKLENQWLQTDNINALIFNPFVPLGEFELNYQLKKGNLKPSQSSNYENNYGFVAKKILRINDAFFQGQITYSNKNQKQVGWTSRINPSSINPYVLTDSMQGLYKKNYITINGGCAYQINKRFAGGININYSVADGARIKDPRPKNKLYTLEFIPSLIFTVSKLKIGSCVYWKQGRESIKYEVVEPMVSYKIFRLLGLGKGRKVINTQFCTRNYYSKQFGASVQLQYVNNSSSLLWNCEYKKSKEEAEDGSLATKKADSGDFTDNNIQTHIIFNREGVVYHSARLQLMYHNFIGTEFIQQAYLEDNITKYRTITTIDNYKQQIMIPSIHYALGLKKSECHYKWLIHFNSEYIINNTEYIDEAKREINNLLSSISIDRVFTLNKSYLEVSAFAGYNYNIDNDLTQLRQYKAKYEIDAWNNIVQPNFELQTANVSSFGFNAIFTKKIKLGNYKTKSFVGLETKLYSATIAEVKKEFITAFVQLGVTF